jgi:hypothetical protein
MSPAAEGDDTHFTYARIVGPTDIGWHRPRNDVEVAARALFPQARGSFRGGGHWWLMLHIGVRAWSRESPRQLGLEPH